MCLVGTPKLLSDLQLETDFNQKAPLSATVYDLGALPARFL